MAASFDCGEVTALPARAVADTLSALYNLLPSSPPQQGPTSATGGSAFQPAFAARPSATGYGPRAMASATSALPAPARSLGFRMWQALQLSPPPAKAAPSGVALKLPAASVGNGPPAIGGSPVTLPSSLLMEVAIAARAKDAPAAPPCVDVPSSTLAQVYAQAPWAAAEPWRHLNLLTAGGSPPLQEPPASRRASSSLRTEEFLPPSAGSLGRPRPQLFAAAGARSAHVAPAEVAAGEVEGAADGLDLLHGFEERRTAGELPCKPLLSVDLSLRL